ncbi:YggT family protein [Candidatus Gillettellia adelgis]
MLTMSFIVKTVIDLYVMVLLLCIWIQWVRLNFYDPFSKFVFKITQSVVTPLRNIIPSLERLDSASLILAFLLMLIKYPVLLLIQGSNIQFNLYNLLFGLISLIKSAGYLIFWMIIIRSLMNWTSQDHSVLNNMIFQLTEPLMVPIRRVIPVMGDIDCSAMSVVLFLYLMNYLGIDLLGAVWFLL